MSEATRSHAESHIRCSLTPAPPGSSLPFPVTWHTLGPPHTGVPFVVIPVQGSVRQNAAPSPHTPTQQEEKASEQRQQLSQQGRSAGDGHLGH